MEELLGERRTRSKDHVRKDRVHHNSLHSRGSFGVTSES